jgi:hypothetical protein
VAGCHCMRCNSFTKRTSDVLMCCARMHMCMMTNTCRRHLPLNPLFCICCSRLARAQAARRVAAQLTHAGAAAEWVGSWLCCRSAGSLSGRYLQGCRTGQARTGQGRQQDWSGQTAGLVRADSRTGQARQQDWSGQTAGLVRPDSRHWSGLGAKAECALCCWHCA